MALDVTHPHHLFSGYMEYLQYVRKLPALGIDKTVPFFDLMVQEFRVHRFKYVEHLHSMINLRG